MWIGERFEVIPFWKLTYWGLYPFYNFKLGFGFNMWDRGGDEWGNKSLCLVIPFVAQFVYFQRKGFDRSGWWFSGSRNEQLMYYSPDGKWSAEIPASALPDIADAWFADDEDFDPKSFVLREEDVAKLATRVRQTDAT